ncbi:MAG: DUF4892 domain-containing protein [Halioglobus sp.]
MLRLFVAFLVWMSLTASLVHAESPEDLLSRFDGYPHAVIVNQSDTAVVDHEIGLGAIQKVRGVWRFKTSERQTGRLIRYTWQITDGFTSSEVLAEIEAEVSAAELLFSCEGRSCGQGVQWANRVFRERVLYGRDDLQKYRVYGPAQGPDYRLILFSSARTADRQYLHAELLQITP